LFLLEERKSEQKSVQDKFLFGTILFWFVQKKEGAHVMTFGKPWL